MTDKELMQQALNALESCADNGLEMWFDEHLVSKSITALRGRLEQPEQEPVAWANSNDLQNFDMRVRTNGGPLHTVPLYTTPQQRKSLDEMTVFDLADQHMYEGGKNYGILEFARAIEAAHGIES